MNEQSRAKALFTSYLGNKIHMFRERVLEEYKQYEITAEEEAEWLNELIRNLTDELSIRDWEAVSRLDAIAAQAKHADILLGIMSFTSRHLMSADSIVKLMYAERLVSVIRQLEAGLTNEQLRDAYIQTMSLFEHIIQSPLVVDAGHELAQFNLSDKRSLNNRARIGMEALKKIVEI